MIHLSVIVPVFNEMENIPMLRQRLETVFQAMPGVMPEIVLVDDHSEDGSDHLIEKWASECSTVRSIRFSRNFGSHSAVDAGLNYCTGDCAVVLAADLQGPPELIPELLARWNDKYDVVWAARERREQDKWSTRFFARMYYLLMRRLGLPNMPQQGADFFLVGRRVIDAYKAISEKNTSVHGMILWLGFRQTAISYVRQGRKAGRSKWSLGRKLKLAVDSVVSFSYLPIRFMSLVGILASTLGLLYSVVILVNALFGHPVHGWSSVMVVILILGGLQLTMLGVLGEYLWRNYDESRGRPRYVIERCSIGMAEHLEAYPVRTNAKAASTHPPTEVTP